MLRTASYSLSIIAAVFTAFLVAILAKDALPAMVSGEIFSEGYWDFHTQHYAALAMFFGSAVVALLAMVIAVPIGLGAAIFLSEYLNGKVRSAVKILIELLAGIPSVVYGLLGVAFLIPLAQPILVGMGGVTGDSLITAGVLLAVMVLPTMITFGDDALRCVPWTMREEALGLGLSRFQVIASVVVPKAWGGICGAAMLALGRAIGETIAVYLVIGRADRPFSFETLSLENLLQVGQSLTTKLGGSEIAIAYGDDQHWQQLMALGLSLWIVVAVLSLISERVLGTRH